MKKKKTEEKPGNPQLLLRLPDELGPRLIKAAIKQGATVQAVILGIVALHFGVEVAPPQRGQPKKSVDE